MSEGAFKALVDKYFKETGDLGKAISMASEEDSQYVDPFLKMKQAAIDNGKML